MPPHRILTHFRAYHLTSFRRLLVPCCHALAPLRRSLSLRVAFHRLPVALKCLLDAL